MNTPITTEYALEKLKNALKNGTQEEIEKWDMCIRSNNDLRIRTKQRLRYIQESNLRAQYKRYLSIINK